MKWLERNKHGTAESALFAHILHQFLIQENQNELILTT